VRAGAADLRPQGCFHVLAEWGNRVARKPVNTSRDPLDILATFELYKAYRVQPGVESSDFPNRLMTSSMVRLSAVQFARRSCGDRSPIGLSPVVTIGY
jgi:hypothetical protein